MRRGVDILNEYRVKHSLGDEWQIFETRQRIARILRLGLWVLIQEPAA